MNFCNELLPYLIFFSLQRHALLLTKKRVQTRNCRVPPNGEAHKYNSPAALDPCHFRYHNYSYYFKSSRWFLRFFLLWKISRFTHKFFFLRFQKNVQNVLKLVLQMSNWFQIEQQSFYLWLDYHLNELIVLFHCFSKNTKFSFFKINVLPIGRLYATEAKVVTN